MNHSGSLQEHDAEGRRGKEEEDEEEGGQPHFE